jgi:hypothetical protein
MCVGETSRRGAFDVLLRDDAPRKIKTESHIFDPLDEARFSRIFNDSGRRLFIGLVEFRSSSIERTSRGLPPSVG